MNINILIIDDNIKFSNTLAKNLNHAGYKCLEALNSSLAFSSLKENRINIILLDIMLGNEDGIEILKKLFEINPHIPVIMMTGYASIESAVESIKIGAFDYIQKPIQYEKLNKMIEKAAKFFELKNENENLKERLNELFPKIITKNKEMLGIVDRIRKLSKTNLPILIYGENGTGKEILADLIHLNSDRAAYKMLKVNCASFPETLLDNELFGHEKEAYTGANSVYKGVFEIADRSTLFLDEIGDMSLSIQAKVLRVLQNFEVKRLGGNEIITVNVRFIAATNKNLEAHISENKFREDLFYRLNTAIIKIPPLRNRKEDIPILTQYFLNEYSENNSKKINIIHENVLEIFFEYHWPGNIRELKNTVFYACALTDNEIIDTDSLPPNFIINKGSNKKTINDIQDNEKNLLIRRLQKYKNNKKKTSESLNISRSSLYSKMKKYGLDINE